MTESIRGGLAPVVGADARVLLLGSFPSERSLQSRQYYANPRNQFWPLLGAVFGFDPAMPYAELLHAVTSHGVALWDVLHSCRRAGSMDTNIDRKTLVVNDFGELLQSNPGIERVFLNGLTAFDLFTTHVNTELPTARLPSSSPAMTMSFADKLTAWRAVASADR